MKFVMKNLFFALLIVGYSQVSFAHPQDSDNMTHIPLESQIQTGTNLNILPNSTATTIGAMETPYRSRITCEIIHNQKPNDRILRAGRVFTITAVKSKSVYSGGSYSYASMKKAIVLEVSGAEGIESFACSYYQSESGSYAGERLAQIEIRFLREALRGIQGEIRFSEPQVIE